MKPSISIIIPSFNQGRFIERTLLSILRQDYDGKIEVIVSDGGSTDETLDVLKKYPQVRWWSEKDHGIADATNKGLSVAHGELLAIQSSDDFYFQNAFRYTAEHLLQNTDLAIASGCDVYVQPDGVTFSCSALDDHRVDARSLLMRRVFPQHCTFFRREVIDRIGLLIVDLAEGAEIDFWYRALHHFAGAFIPRHTAAYQLHAQQRTQTGKRWLESLKKIVESNENDPAFGELFRLSDDDRFNLYTRWQAITAAISGSQTDLNAALIVVSRDDRITQETRDCLALHGLLPKPAKDKTAPRHANHAVPDFNWWREGRGRIAA